MHGGRIRIGIGGWTFEPWRGAFYPSGLPHRRELEYASRHLTSIEINGTFYGSQKPQSFVRWYEETPGDFVFALKAPRFATNRRELATAGESIERFFTSGVMELRDKLGPVNWQLPPTKRFDPQDLGRFLELLPREIDGRPLRHAVEARHESFRDPQFVAIARERGVAIVVAGDSEHPQIADITAPFVYARIMGTVEIEARGYAEVALDRWAGCARTWAAGGEPEGLDRVTAPSSAGDNTARGRDVFLYVIGGHKVSNPAAAGALLDRLT